MPLMIGRGRRLTSLLLLLFLTGYGSPALAVKFNANWDYRQTGGEEIDTRREFRQRYNLGVGPAFTYQPTHAISASGGVSYTRTESGDEQGTQDFSTTTPYGQLSLVNDIFTSQLSGETSRSGGSNRSSWDFFLGSSWSVPLWPNLRFSYGERTEATDTSSIFDNQEFDSKSEDTTFSIDWDLILAKLFYNYSNSLTTDQESSSSIESDTHSARLETGGRFWEDRFSFNFAQRFQTTDVQTEVESTGDEGFDFPLEGQTLSAITDPDVLLDPLPGEPWQVDLQSNPALGNGVFNDEAVAVPPDQRVHLAVRFDDFEQRVDLVRITLDTLTDDAAAASLEWSLYVRDPLDTGWELAVEVLSSTYDSAENQFEIPVNRFETEIMLVAINQTQETFLITEFEAFSLFTEDFSSTSTSYLSNLAVRYRITRTLSASGSLTLEHNESEFADQSFEVDRQSVNGNLRWAPSPLLNPSLGYSEFREERAEQPEQLTRNYSVNVASYPLETLNLSFGATLNERLTGGEKIRTSTRYNLNTRAILYPDLTAAWYLSYVDSEFRNQAGEEFNDNAFTSRLNLNAQLTRKLRADLDKNYLYRVDDQDTRQTADVTLRLRYRPSDRLALRGSYTTYLLESERTDELLLGLDLRVVQTYKTRLTLNATHTQAEQTTESLALTGSWDISEYLSMRGSGNYRFSERDRYSFQVALYLRL